MYAVAAGLAPAEIPSRGCQFVCALSRVAVAFCSPIATRTLGKAGRLNIVSSVSVSGLNYCAEIYGQCGSKDVVRDGALDARCALPLAKGRLRYSHRSCQRSKRPVTKQAVSFASITVKTKRYYGLHLAYRTSQSGDIAAWAFAFSELGDIDYIRHGLDIIFRLLP
jgi:hypothetical protein